MVDVTTGRLAIPIPEDSDPMGLMPETFRDAAVQLEDQLNMIGYTANWDGGGGGTGSEGAGQFRAQYRYTAQDVIRLHIWLKLGTGFTLPTGQWRFRLPVPGIIVAPATAPIQWPGIASLFDSSANDSYRGACRIVTNDATRLVLNVDPTTAGANLRQLTSTVPFTWAVNDELAVQMEYQTDGTDPS